MLVMVWRRRLQGGFGVFTQSRYTANRDHVNSGIVSLADRYKAKPVLRALVQLVPFGIGSAADSFLVGRLEQIHEDRFRVFFDELAEGKVEVSSAMAESEDFLQAFAATTRAVSRTRRREKTRLFARLLRGAFAESIGSIDEFEELLSILDELSFRELIILGHLARLERSTPFAASDNDLQRAEKVWPELETVVRSQLGLEPEQLAPILVRLQRSGCYTEITGGYWDYSGGRGRLTTLYYRLESVIGHIDAVAV